MKSFSKKFVGLAVVTALVLLVCGTVQAGVVNVAAGTSSSELTFAPQMSTTDLINIGQPSFVSSANTVAPVNMFAFSINGTNDGEAASFADNQAEAIAHDTWYLYEEPSTTLTYTLNTNPLTGGSALGYDISGVNVFAGWQDTNVFDAQKWTFRVSTLSNPTFTDIKAVDFMTTFLGLNQPGAKSSLVSLTDSTGTIATGVTAVQFFVEKSSKTGCMGIVFQEIDVLGTATIPEPSTLVLFGIAALAFGFAKIRRRA